MDGISFPSKPFQMNFSEGRWLEAYDGLLDALGQKHQLRGGLLMNREHWALGYTVYAFDLSASWCGRNALGLIKQGNVFLSLTFDKPLPKTLMCLSVLYFDGK